MKAQRYEMKKKKEGKKSALTDERIYLLEELGFVWSPKAKELIGTELWLKRYGELKAYQAEYGDTEVPKNHPPNKPLGNWVITQRKYNSEKESAAQVREEICLSRFAILLSLDVLIADFSTMYIDILCAFVILQVTNVNEWTQEKSLR